MKLFILLLFINNEGKIIRDEKLFPKFLTDDELSRIHEIGKYLPKGFPPPYRVRTPAEYERVQCVF